ncbi:MAG: tetratricopeptide repeat protein, partial [Burkholderiaceae bacterium]
MLRSLFLLSATLSLLACASAPRPEIVDANTKMAPPAAVAAAPAQPAPSVSTDSAARAEGIPDVNVSSALVYQLMAAEVAAQRGELGSAYAVYMKLARETRDARLARRAAELALQGRAMAEGLEAAKLWHELIPGSAEAAQTLAMLYAGTGRFDDAYALFSAQLQGGPTQPAEELSRLQRALARTQDRAGAFQLLER